MMDKPTPRTDAATFLLSLVESSRRAGIELAAKVCGAKSTDALNKAGECLGRQREFYKHSAACYNECERAIRALENNAAAQADPVSGIASSEKPADSPVAAAPNNAAQQPPPSAQREAALALVAQLAEKDRQIEAMRKDAERLDFLDSITKRTNERNRSVYGWRFDINHNRAALTDHNLPPLLVREAIDAAKSQESSRRANEGIRRIDAALKKDAT